MCIDGYVGSYDYTYSARHKSHVAQKTVQDAVRSVEIEGSSRPRMKASA